MCVSPFSRNGIPGKERFGMTFGFSCCPTGCFFAGAIGNADVGEKAVISALRRRPIQIGVLFYNIERERPEYLRPFSLAF